VPWSLKGKRGIGGNSVLCLDVVCLGLIALDLPCPALSFCLVSTSSRLDLT
jgi:hypothetical protein